MMEVDPLKIDVKKYGLVIKFDPGLPYVCHTKPAPFRIRVWYALRLRKAPLVFHRFIGFCDFVDAHRKAYNLMRDAQVLDVFNVRRFYE